MYYYTTFFRSAKKLFIFTTGRYRSTEKEILMSRLFIITTPKLQETGEFSYKFMMQDGMPEEVMDYCTVWGMAKTRRRADDEVDPFKLIRGEADAIGDNGIRRWDIHLFSSGGSIFSGSCDQSPPDEVGLQGLIADVFESYESAVLLVPHHDFATLESVCNVLNIEVSAHHHGVALSTS